MNAAEVCDAIGRAQIIPVVRAPSADLALRAVDALAEGGLRVFEVTLTIPGGVGVIESLAKRFSDSPELLVGAGTVLNKEDAAACINAGTQFILSPGFDAQTVALAKEKDIAVMPGALTPTEVLTAWNAGASMVKIFPCSAMGGASYLKALKAPLPQVKLVPTGGVNQKNAREFLDAGAEALGIGANLVDINAMQKDGPSALVSRAKAYLDAIRG